MGRGTADIIVIRQTLDLISVKDVVALGVSAGLRLILAVDLLLEGSIENRPRGLLAFAHTRPERERLSIGHPPSRCITFDVRRGPKHQDIHPPIGGAIMSQGQGGTVGIPCPRFPPRRRSLLHLGDDRIRHMLLDVDLGHVSRSSS